MKKRITIFLASLSLTIVFGMGLMAQEKTEVFVQIKKDGKVLKDTTYQFEDESEAKHAIQVMEVLSGEEKHMEHINVTMAHSGEGSSKAMVFISEDGKTSEITQMNGDSLVWISEDDHPHGEHVVIVKSGDGETFDILIDEDELHEAHGNVFISDDDENVYVIKGDGEDVHMEIEEIMKEHGDEENVKVIVIKKGGDHDHDEDVDHDHEVEKEVEVKVIKKEKKK
jgi:hypothetical protein